MTNKNKHIPQGYKDSPLGIIPKEWEVKRLGELCKKIGSGITPRGGQNVYLSQGRPFMRSQNVANGYLLLDDVVFIDEKTHQKQKSTEIELDDVLLNITGASIGRSAIATSEIVGGNVNQHVCIIRLKDKTLSYYICTFLLSYIGQKQIDSYQAGGNREGLNYDQIASFKICIPSSKEIIQIWNYLSLWDTAIEKQSELIEKLTLRKRALMQQLLTGKKRLPGFSGEWKRIAIKTFAKEVSIRNGSGNEYIVLSCTKYDGLVPSLEYFGKQIYSNDLSSYKIVPQNHFVYATNHIEEGSIGYQSNYENGLISPMYTVFSTNDNIVDDTFLFAILKSHHLIYLYQSMMEGSINRRGGLRWDSFSTIKINLPSLDEQKAISVFLHDMNKEIELANEKLANLQSQKRGLMQQLLTGKKRVVQL